MTLASTAGMGVGERGIGVGDRGARGPVGAGVAGETGRNGGGLEGSGIGVAVGAAA
jgi:hypothetical protein